MLPLFGKLCPSVRQAFLFSGSIIRVLRQTFRSSGSIVRVLDSTSATQEASSECSTALPRLRKHRPSVRQAFRGSGSIVGVLDRPSAAQEASSSYSRLMTSAGFSWAARQTRQLILNPTTNNKTRKTPNAGAIGIDI